MRPGKLFKLIDSTTFYELNVPKRPTWLLEPGTIFMVVSVKPPETWPDPIWQILVEDKIGLIEVTNVRMLDITPFTENKK